MLTRIQEPHKYEHTGILSDGSVVHYTCNLPSNKALEKYGISSLEWPGYEDLGLLHIPAGVFARFGYEISQKTNNSALKITAENLLARL